MAQKHVACRLFTSALASSGLSAALAIAAARDGEIQSVLCVAHFSPTIADLVERGFQLLASDATPAAYLGSRFLFKLRCSAAPFSSIRDIRGAESDSQIPTYCSVYDSWPTLPMSKF